MVAKHTYRLSRYSAAEWEAALSAATLETAKPSEGEVGLEIECGELDFTLYVEGADGKPSTLGHQHAQNVMAQIVDMDNAVRSMDISGDDADEHLAWVKASPSEVIFHYWGTAFNTEWSVAFKPSKAGKWEFDLDRKLN